MGMMVRKIDEAQKVVIYIYIVNALELKIKTHSAQSLQIHSWFWYQYVELWDSYRLYLEVSSLLE